MGISHGISMGVGDIVNGLIFRKSTAFPPPEASMLKHFFDVIPDIEVDMPSTKQLLANGQTQSFAMCP